MGLRHLLACVGIHLVWCIRYIFPDVLVTIETLMLRSLRLELTGSVRWRGFAWDSTWWSFIWCPLETFRRCIWGTYVVWWWPVLSYRHRLISLGRHSLTLVSSKVARQGPGCSLHLVRLLGRDLVALFASQGRSTGTWSPAPPHKVAR
jgi:hypothetical protein